MISQCRHIPGCWDSVSEAAHGSKGTCYTDDRGRCRVNKENTSVKGERNPYEQEHVDLIAAIRSMPDVQLAIKPHPAETAGAYEDAAGAPNVKVLSESAPLADLLAAASALVTVNSTVAIDALALGLPSLVIGLPNNLTPFVEAGTMAGARSSEEIRASLERLLYDQEFRRQLARATESFVAEFRPAASSVSDDAGGAAARAGFSRAPRRAARFATAAPRPRRGLPRPRRTCGCGSPFRSHLQLGHEIGAANSVLAAAY